METGETVPPGQGGERHSLQWTQHAAVCGRVVGNQLSGCKGRASWSCGRSFFAFPFAME